MMPNTSILTAFGMGNKLLFYMAWTFGYYKGSQSHFVDVDIPTIEINAGRPGFPIRGLHPTELMGVGLIFFKSFIQKILIFHTSMI